MGRRFQLSAEAAHGNHTASCLASCNGPHDQKRLLPRDHRVRQWRVRRLMRKILLAGEEPQERPALLCHMVADRPPQHRIVRLECVDDGTLRNRTLDLDLHFPGYMRQPPQVWRKHNPNKWQSSPRRRNPELAQHISILQLAEQCRTNTGPSHNQFGIEVVVRGQLQHAISFDLHVQNGSI
jgi:hypothetical protein